MEFQNQAVNIEALPEYQNTTLNPINKKYKWVIFWYWIIISLILSVGCFIISTDSELSNYLYPAIITSLLLSLAYILLQIAGFKSRAYMVREHDIIYRHGILSVITTIIPYKRIQHVSVSEGFLSRIYKLASIQIYTAGGSSDDLKIKGLAKEDAMQIKEYVLSKIK